MTVQAFSTSCLSVSVPKICYISPEGSDRVTSLGKGKMKLAFIVIFLTFLYSVCSQEEHRNYAFLKSPKERSVECLVSFRYSKYAIFSDNYFACLLGVKSCAGGEDWGTDENPKNTCSLNSNDHMWYYHSGKQNCLKLNYLGCGGNRNRFCSKQDCISKCIEFSSSESRYPMRPYHH